jgi:S-adenosylmethionine:tRNA ribosyltransferase-isomerase
MIRLSDFDFHLPDENIALRPAEPRDSARLLIVDAAQERPIKDADVKDIVAHFRPGDVMIFNDTRVIPAHFQALRLRSDLQAKVEITLHKRLSTNSWLSFARPGKRLALSDRVSFGDGKLWASVADKDTDGNVTLVFNVSSAELDAAIAICGTIPLPPYIAHKRAVDARDLQDYQTVYAQKHGAVAAPTAGLHFTPELLQAIDAKGVMRHHVTLHVGAGTFLPVKTDDVSEHRMHSEWGEVSAEVADAINQAHATGARVICVGTTSLRLIESAAGADGQVRPFSGDTAIFITPGYRFKAVDLLMTNFHLPKSTLFMLVSAFAGQALMRQAYEHAIASGYRFYSYGDSSLLYRAT